MASRLHCASTVILVLGLIGCGGSGSSGSSGSDDDVVEDQVAEDMPSDGDGFVLEPAPFLVLIDGPTLADIDQAVTLEVFLFEGDPVGALGYSWTAEGGRWVTDDGQSTRSITFDEEGQFSIQVDVADAEGKSAVARFVVFVVDGDGVEPLGDLDESGMVDQDDVDALDELLDEERTPSGEEVVAADLDLDTLLTGFDRELLVTALGNGLAPDAMWPLEGARGRRVQVIHPALLDPSTTLEIAFGDTATSRPVRLRPGYATTVVPLTLSAADTLDVTITVDDSEVARFEFEVLAPSEPSDPPGAMLIEGFEQIEAGVGLLNGFTSVLVEAAELDEEAAALVAVWLDVATSDVATAARNARTAYADLQPETLEFVEEMALNNGLEDALEALNTVIEELAEQAAPETLTIAEGEALAALICYVNQLADTVERTADIIHFANQLSGPVNELAGLYPPAKIVTEIVDTVLSVLDIGMELITYLLRFLPDFNDRLQISAPAGPLYPGESGPVTAAVPLGFRADMRLCDDTNIELNWFLLTVGRAYLDEAVGKIPIAGMVYSAATQSDYVDQFMDEVVLDSLTDGQRELVVELLGPLCAKVLEFQDNPRMIPVNPEDRVAPRCGAIVDTGDGEHFTWTCTSGCARSDGGTSAHILYDLAYQPQLCGRVTRQSPADTLCVLCGPGNCEEGCCDEAGECQGGTADDECGTGGEFCEDCTQNSLLSVCRAHDCACQSTCDPDDPRRCRGDDVIECQEVTRGSGCYDWFAVSDCVGLGGTCQAGECVGGCGEHNCEDGCCQVGEGGARTCVAGTALDACGTGGMACVDCGDSDDGDIDRCNAGSCDCSHECEPDAAECVGAREFADQCTGRSENGCLRFERTACDLSQHEHCFAGACCEQEDDETNDTREDASAISPPGVTGRTLHSQDFDVYTFELCDGGVAFAELFMAPGSTASLTIEYQDGEEIRWERQVIVGLEGTASRTFSNFSGATRTYYLTVGTPISACTTYGITLDIDCPTCQDDRFEDNDSSSDSVRLPATGVTVEGLVLSGAEEDYFDVFVCAGATLSVDAAFADGEGEGEGNLDFDVTVQSAVVASGTSGTSNESVTWENLGGRNRNAVIRIFSPAEAVCVDYDLTVSADGCSCREDFYETFGDGDDTIPTGEEVSQSSLRRPQGTTYSSMSIANGEDAQDDDWFSIPVCGFGVFTAELRYVSESGDLDLELWTDGDTPALIEDVSGTSEPVILTFGNESADEITVNLRATADATPACVPYELWMVESCPCVDDDNENGTRETAMALTESAEGVMKSGTDDWFLVEYDAGCRASVIAQVDERLGDPVMQVFDSDGRLIGEGESGHNSLRYSRLNFEDVATDYEFRLTVSDGLACVPYSLEIETDCTSCAPDVWEPNESAFSGPMASEASGSFRNLAVEPTDSDYFSLLREDDCSMHIELRYEGDTAPDVVLKPEAEDPISPNLDGDFPTIEWPTESNPFGELKVTIEGDGGVCVPYELVWDTTCE